jgi:hypothetical protein
MKSSDAERTMEPRRKIPTRDGTVEGARKPYHPPKLSEYGSLAKLTAGGGAGSLEQMKGKDKKTASKP